MSPRNSLHNHHTKLLTINQPKHKFKILVRKRLHLSIVIFSLNSAKTLNKHTDSLSTYIVLVLSNFDLVWVIMSVMVIGHGYDWHWPKWWKSHGQYNVGFG